MKLTKADRLILTTLYDYGSVVVTLADVLRPEVRKLINAGFVHIYVCGSSDVRLLCLLDKGKQEAKKCLY